MDMPTFDAAQVHRAGFGTVSFGSDDRLIVWFFEKPLINGIESKKLGRPVYENVPHVHIQQPGERDFLECPATEEHKMRFARKWEAFSQNKESQKVEGTLLSVLFPSNQAVVENLKHFSIYTVEQLAALTDTQIQNVGLGGRDFVNLAKRFLEQAEKGKDFHALADEIEALRRQREADQQRIAALEAALADAGEDQRKPRGRPRNVA